MKVKKFFVSLLCLVMLIGLLPTIAFAATTINSVDILVTHPVHLAAPETYVEIYGNCQLDTTYRDQGHNFGLRWKNVATGEYMDANSTFVGGQAYELSVMLLHLNGYAFSASDTSITINTEPATVSVIDATRARATITLIAANLYINTVSIQNLDAPIAGNKPDFSVTLQEDTCNLYFAGASCAITWYDLDRQVYLSENDAFEAGHRYSAGIQIQAKQGYEFPQNALATVNGIVCNTTVQNNGQILTAVMEYPALAETHTHTPSEWRITGAYHYKACTTCGDFLEQEDHMGGVATCAEKGKCSICGYEYIDVNENHIPDTTQWVIRGDMYHYHACKLCGAHCDIGEHVAGPAGTPNAAVVCKDCGYIITPHTHNLTKIPKKDATCSDPGNVEYYTCDGCSDFFADSEGQTIITDTVIAPLGHKICDDWQYDKDNHWRICSVCKEILTETQMSHEMNGAKCATCGFERTVPETAPGTEPSTEPETVPGTIPGTEPETPPGTVPDTEPETVPGPDNPENDKPGQQGKENDSMPWVALLLIAVGAVAIGVAVGIMARKMKKKV